jgi:hypothetical protein
VKNGKWKLQDEIRGMTMEAMETASPPVRTLHFSLCRSTFPKVPEAR